MVSCRGIGEALNIRATQTKAVKLSDRMKCDIGHGTADEKMMEMEVMVTSVRFAANGSYYIILTPRDVTFWRSRIHSSFLVFFLLLVCFKPTFLENRFTRRMATIRAVIY